MTDQAGGIRRVRTVLLRARDHVVVVNLALTDPGAGPDLTLDHTGRAVQRRPEVQDQKVKVSSPDTK